MNKFKEPLTGVYQKDIFSEIGTYLLALATRSKAPLSICIIDIDHLARVNERFGREIGDKVIQTIAKAIEYKCRRSDLVGYLGEGKIGLVLYDISGINTNMVLNGLRKKIAHEIELLDINKLKVTVTIGASVIHGEMDKETLDVIYNRAYSALHTAKEGGRDRIEVF